MNPLLLPELFNVGRTLLEKFFPDPEARARAEMELVKMQQDGQFKEMETQMNVALAQIATNQAEASSESIFARSWRPAAGWVCVAAFAYAGLIRPLAPWVARLAGADIPDLPPIDDVFTELLFGMLGLGGLRSYEKLRK